MLKYLFYVVIIISIGGCAGPRPFVKAKKASVEEVLEMMKNNAVDYEWFSAKAKVDVKSMEGSVGGRANIRMIRDSLIWMNFKKISIEGSRVWITKDTFFIVYRLEDMYETGTSQELLDAYHINLAFGELQDYMAGNFYIPKREEVESFESKELYKISFTRDNNRMSYWLDGLGRIVKLSIKDTYNRDLSMDCNDFNELGFGEEKQFVFHDENGEKSSIKFNFSQVEINEPKNIPFEVPSHYRKLP